MTIPNGLKYFITQSSGVGRCFGMGGGRGGALRASCCFFVWFKNIHWEITSLDSAPKLWEGGGLQPPKPLPFLRHCKATAIAMSGGSIQYDACMYMCMIDYLWGMRILALLLFLIQHFLFLFWRRLLYSHHVMHTCPRMSYLLLLGLLNRNIINA